MSFSSFVHNFLYPKSAAEQAAEAAAKYEAENPPKYHAEAPDVEPEPWDIASWMERHIKHRYVITRTCFQGLETIVFFLYFQIGHKGYSIMGITRGDPAWSDDDSKQVDVAIKRVSLMVRDNETPRAGMIPIKAFKRGSDIYYGLVKDRYDNHVRVFEAVEKHKNSWSFAVQLLEFGSIFRTSNSGTREPTVGISMTRTLGTPVVSVVYAEFSAACLTVFTKDCAEFKFRPEEIAQVMGKLYAIPTGVLRLDPPSDLDYKIYYSSGYEILSCDCSSLLPQLHQKDHLKNLRLTFREIFSKDKWSLSDYLMRDPVEGGVAFFRYRYSVLDNVWYILYQGRYFDTVIPTESGWEFSDLIDVNPRPVEERLSDMVRHVVDLRNRVDSMRETLGAKSVQVQMSRLTSAAIILAQFRETSTQWPEVEDRVRAILIDSSIAVGSAEIAMDPLNRSCDLLTSPTPKSLR